MNLEHMSEPSLRGAWLCCMLITGLLATAQNEEDALRYSWLLPGGTARSWGLGSAMGAVGADPGSASLNPAGFALYNTSEISLTPGVEVNTADALYYGTAASGTVTRGMVNNFAAMLCYPGKANSTWKSTVFGISYDREATFHWNRPAVGEQVNSTVLQNFVNEANGTPPADLYDTYSFTSGIAWDAYAIDPLDTLANTYSSQIPFGSEVRQTNTIISGGRSQTTSLFLATNWMDKLYMGLSLGIVGVKYDRSTTHTETSLDESLDLKELNYAENLITTGGGVDLKVGILGRVTHRLRMGVSYHSPKWLQLDDTYNTRMTTTFRTPDSEGNVSYTGESPDGIFAYRVNTPWNVLASAAYVAGKNGLVSVDYGITDYRRMKLGGDNSIPDSYDFGYENGVIEQRFTRSQSVRVGTEWRSGNWYFRGGWGWWQDPYAATDARHGSGYKRYSVGTGYRTDHLSFDLALTYGQRTTSYFQYDPALVNATQETLKDYRSLVTIAYRP